MTFWENDQKESELHWECNEICISIWFIIIKQDFPSTKVSHACLFYEYLVMLNWQSFCCIGGRFVLHHGWKDDDLGIVDFSGSSHTFHIRISCLLNEKPCDPSGWILPEFCERMVRWFVISLGLSISLFPTFTQRSGPIRG